MRIITKKAASEIAKFDIYVRLWYNMNNSGLERPQQRIAQPNVPFFLSQTLAVDFFLLVPEERKELSDFSLITPNFFHFIFRAAFLPTVGPLHTYTKRGGGAVLGIEEERKQEETMVPSVPSESFF